ncbi:MAG: helix-turn-helix transcriptional regulator [Desulfosarcinaceae bacterium]|nr:helix-turn-helix transcriptional regulator [Desulfosarcinaceae bacterium]
MKLSFQRNKYGKVLSLDCGLISQTPKFVTHDRPYFITFHEILFITQGSGTFRLDDEKIPFQRGTLLLLPQNRWRQWVEVKAPMDGYFLIFEEEFISTFFNDALFLYRFHYFYQTTPPSWLQVEETDLIAMMAKLEEIRVEIKGLRNDSHHLLRAILYYLLIQINRRYESRHHLRDELFQDWLTLRFRKLLEHNIRTMQKVSDYAQRLNVSRSHLNKTLNASFGKPCKDLIKERLVVEIKKELLYSDRSIAEIGYDFNFSEPGNFIRFFKGMTGQTPKAYRRLNSN